MPPAPPSLRDVDLAPPPGTAGGIARSIKENFEAVVVAFIMALVIRCFCIEVFKIPTASMEPTLMGDDVLRRRGGDRIMVNKFAYEFSDVERYDVLVFKFPLDLTRNFIKRVIGLPNETFWLQDGDVYVQRRGDAAFTLARKPVRAQEGIWIPVYDRGFAERPFRRLWPQRAATNNWDLVEGELRTYVGQGRDPEARFEFAPESFAVHDFEAERQGNRDTLHPVSDLRLGARVKFLTPRGEFELRHVEDRRAFRVILSPGKRVVVLHPDPQDNVRQREAEIDRIIEAERDYRVALLVYDGAVAVLLDGEVVYDVVVRSSLPSREEAPPTTLDFATRGAEAVVRDLAVARDVYYFVVGPGHDRLPADRPVDIPPDSYLLVGDNVRNSHDGRVWQRVETVFEDGSTAWWDAGQFQEKPDSVRFMKKAEGNPHESEVAWEVPRDRIAQVRFPSGMTWVERRHIVGKAFWIWWPPNRWFRLIR